jgi:hypothetical protein
MASRHTRFIANLRHNPIHCPGGDMPRKQRESLAGLSYLPGQLEIAGTAKSAHGFANQSLRPSKPQKPCDHGLFSDDAAQLDLVEMLQEPVDDIDG